MTAPAPPAAAPGQGYGGRIVAVLEDMWNEVRGRHPELPPVVIVTGAGADMRGPKNWNLHGQHCPDRWIVDPAGTRASELFVAGEDLAQGGANVLKIMLHEAAHELAFLRGIKDTSRQHRYHNGRFSDLATELGLTPPGTPHPVSGYSDASLADSTAAAYAALIAAVDASGLPHIDGRGTDPRVDDDPAAADPEAKENRGGQRAALTCECEDDPRKIYLTAKQIGQGPILCGVCNAEFTIPGDDAGEESS